jgi:hypothetical protein
LAMTSSRFLFNGLSFRHMKKLMKVDRYKIII